MMKFNAFSISILLLLFAMNTSAQIGSKISFHWGKPIELPKTKESNTSLGFAGMISGTSNQLMLVAGGANFPDKMPWLGGKKKYHRQIYLYKNTHGHLELVDDSKELPNTLAYAASCTQHNQIFIAGGENDLGIQNKAFILTMQAGKVLYTALPDLPFSVTNAMMIVKSNTLYLLGGEDEKQTQSHLISLDLNKVHAKWKYLQPVPFPVSHGVIALQQVKGKDELFVLGGRTKTANGISTFYDTIISYNFEKDSWAQVGQLPYPISAGTGIQLSAHEIALFGGDKGIVFNQVERLIQAINDAPNAEQKELLNQQKIQLQATHPGFTNDILLFNSSTNKTEQIAKAPFAIPVTSSVLKFGNTFYIASGEIKAGVRSPYIFSFTIARND